jgi:hypothetical protein
MVCIIFITFLFKMSSYVYIIVLHDFKHVQLGHAINFYNLMKIIDDYYLSYGRHLDYYEYKVHDYKKIISNFQKEFKKI